MQAMGINNNLKRASSVLKAMSNERRLYLLCLIADGEKSVGELEGLMNLSQSALSQHLARLRQDGLVTTRRRAQTIFYRLSGVEVLQLMLTLQRLYCEGGLRDTEAQHPHKSDSLNQPTDIY